MLQQSVLVVDDDSISRHVIAKALAIAEIPHMTVASGLEALEALTHARFGIVLLDLMMPGTDGFEVLRQIRENPKTSDLAVVVLTALDRDDDIARAFSSGADDFVRKPFRPVELVARIHSQRRLRQTVLDLAQKERASTLLLELTQKLATNLDFPSILVAVVQRIAEFIHVDRASIVLLGSEAHSGYVVATSDDAELRELAIDLSNYPELLQVIERSESLLIRDAHAHPLLVGALSDGANLRFRSAALIPILFEDKPMGVLALRTRTAVQFDERSIELCQTIANAMAIALRNARVFQTLREQSSLVDRARVEAERRLLALERFAEIFESSADGILVLSTDGKILLSNPRAREVLLSGESELESRSLYTLVIEPDRHRLDGLLQEQKERARAAVVDLRVQRKDQKTIVLSVSLSHGLRSDGVLLFSFREVTDDRALAEELAQTKRFLERVIASSVDAVISVNHMGTVHLFNRAAERIFRRRADLVVGTHVRNLYPEGVPRAVMAAMRQGGGVVEGFRTEVVDGEGESVPVSISATLMFENERFVGSVGVLTDLRERTQMQKQLQEAQHRLLMRERHAAVVELAGAAAHELNQPLTSVLGYSELLKRRLDPTSPAYCSVEIIYSEVLRMADIVRKIGHLTRYETKDYVGNARIVDLERASSEDEAPKSRP